MFVYISAYKILAKGPEAKLTDYVIKGEIYSPSNFTFTQRLVGFYFEREAPVVLGQIKELTLFYGGCAASQQEGAGLEGTGCFDQESCENQ